MSIKFTCDDKATLVAYLYGEIDPPGRKAVDDHLATCAACAAEVTALGDVRSELGLWAPPEVELDFEIVKRSQAPATNVLRPAQWWNTVPVWAQAAAAVLIVGVGLGAANVQVKSGPEGLTVSTGWMQTFDASSPNDVRTALAQGKPADAEWKAALVSLEQQLRTEIRSAREDQATRVASRGDVDEVTLRRVQQLIGDAEQRHERELAGRFVEFARDMDMQRRADRQAISRGLTSYESEVLRQRQMLNNVIRISSPPQQ